MTVGPVKRIAQVDIQEIFESSLHILVSDRGTDKSLQQLSANGSAIPKSTSTSYEAGNRADSLIISDENLCCFQFQELGDKICRAVAQDIELRIAGAWFVKQEWTLWRLRYPSTREGAGRRHLSLVFGGVCIFY